MRNFITQIMIFGLFFASCGTEKKTGKTQAEPPINTDQKCKSAEITKSPQGENKADSAASILGVNCLSNKANLEASNSPKLSTSVQKNQQENSENDWQEKPSTNQQPQNNNQDTIENIDAPDGVIARVPVDETGNENASGIELRLVHTNKKLSDQHQILNAWDQAAKISHTTSDKELDLNSSTASSWYFYPRNYGWGGWNYPWYGYGYNYWPAYWHLGNYYYYNTLPYYFYNYGYNYYYYPRPFYW